MRIALLSDIHSNIPALEACLSDAFVQDIDQVYVLGDLVGYGPFPVETVQRCQALERSGAIVLRGNHDEVILTPQSGSHFKTSQERVADWTYQQLDPVSRHWLSTLPLTHSADGLSFVHGTMDNPAAWYYANQHIRVKRSLDAAMQIAGSWLVFCGHVHEQRVFYQGAGREYMPFTPSPGVAIKVSPARRWLITVGSVGQPRDGDQRAGYAIFDTNTMAITFFRVPYDVRKTITALNENGLPHDLGERLELGR